LGTTTENQKRSLQNFRFIGVGESQHGPLAPVSEQHDEALAEVLSEEHRR
jgi:hypothetical protein